MLTAPPLGFWQLLRRRSGPPSRILSDAAPLAAVTILVLQVGGRSGRD
ncbi:MAG TPA: hypothetical protein VGR06_04855 [Actinophytocola sp.]|nr:hypothetical protein [Actinophytocola sp.]